MERPHGAISVPLFNVPCLDGLRACAFLLVFVAHAGADKIIPGGLGVTVFFFLSGYLITTLLRIEAHNSGSISLRRFYLRRSLRILPPMYITLALVYAWAHFGPHHSGNALGLFSALAYFWNYADLLLGGRANLPTGIGLLWSLMIEEHFYLIFPFVYQALIRRGTPRARQGSVLITICAGVLLWRCYLVFFCGVPLSTLPRWTYSATDTRFDSILWGCVLGVCMNPWFAEGPGWLKRRKGLFALGGLSLLVITLAWREPHVRETLRYTLQAIGLYPVFYYCVSSPKAIFTRWLTVAPLRWIGWTSYSMYLIHFTVLIELNRRFVGHPVACACLALGASLLYSTGMRQWVELPIRARRSEGAAALHRALASGVGERILQVAQP